MRRGRAGWKRAPLPLMLPLMSTDARCSARRYYAGSGRSLATDLAAFAANPRGVIVFLPQLVALMKPVELARPEAWQQLVHSPERADAWYIHLLAGDLGLARALGRLLAPLPWLCFQRGARSPRLHCRRWARFISNQTHTIKNHHGI